MIQVQCPAKVNLFLEVAGRRRDGYHNLATLFAKINLFDILDFEARPEPGVELTVENQTTAPLEPGPDNLVVRAAQAFRQEFDLEHGFRIRLVKKIPIGAGLGGGSSDAAGTLVGLARLTGLTMDRSVRARLKRIARALGADVGFFLLERPYAIGQSIGDRLEAVEVRRAPPPMVLVYPRVAVSTAGVYRSLGYRPPRGGESPRPMILTKLSQLGKLHKKLAHGRPISEWAGLLFNRLEEPVLQAYGQVQQAKDILVRLGAQGALMSGSGSSVFGFFPSQEEAEVVARRLRGYPWEVFVTCCF